MSQVTSFDNNPIYVSDSGSGETTLLFIHGWNLDHSFWQSQTEHFAPNYRIITMDLPGYGASGKNREAWTMQAYARDVRAVIDQMKLENVILVAHSMGGNIALEALNLDASGIIGLIGVDNFKQVGIESPPEEGEQVEAFLQMLEADYPTNVRLTSESFMFSPESPAEPKERVLSQYAAQDPAIAIPVVADVFGADGLSEARLLANVNVPFAVVSSTYAPMQEAGIIDNYTGPFFKVYPIDGCGHFPMVERPAEFNRLLEMALREML